MKILLLDIDLAWLAGLLEGEGSFCWHQTKQRDKHGRPRVQVQMADRDIVERVAKLIGGNFKGPYGPYGVSKLQTWFAHTSGENAYEVMKAVLPYMGERRSAMIKQHMERYEAIIG